MDSNSFLANRDIHREHPQNRWKSQIRLRCNFLGLRRVHSTGSHTHRYVIPLGMRQSVLHSSRLLLQLNARSQQTAITHYRIKCQRRYAQAIAMAGPLQPRADVLLKFWRAPSLPPVSAVCSIRENLHPFHVDPTRQAPGLGECPT